MKIPTLNELTETQRLVANTPFGHNLVVTGAPGTGKTIIAVYLAQKYAEMGKKVLFLVSGELLKSFIESEMVSDGINLEIRTPSNWISELYQQGIGGITSNQFSLGKPVTPTKSKIINERLGDGSRRPIKQISNNWEKIYQDIRNAETFYDCIIIDETQDRDMEFLSSIKSITKYMICFLDEDQGMNIGITKVEQVNNLLGIRSEIVLKENFRNSKEIFNLAECYGNKHDLDCKNQTTVKPQLFWLDDDEDLVDCIVKLMEHLPDKGKTGIFCTSDKCYLLYEALSHNLPIQWIYLYKPDSSNWEFHEVDFSKEAIFVIPYEYALGLEFDTVINAWVDQIETETKLPNKQAYIAFTRARKYLFCTHNPWRMKYVGKTYQTVTKIASKSKAMESHLGFDDFFEEFLSEE